MLARTHLAFGFLSALALLPFINAGSNKYLFFGAVLIASLFPDIDQPNSKISNNIPLLSKIVNAFSKHRGIFHSAFCAFLLPGLVWYFLSNIYGVALFIGYMSHLVIDGFTKSGINFLHPFAKLHLSGFVETGTMMEWIVLFVIVAGIVVKLI